MENVVIELASEELASANRRRHYPHDCFRRKFFTRLVVLLRRPRAPLVSSSFPFPYACSNLAESEQTGLTPLSGQVQSRVPRGLVGSC